MTDNKFIARVMIGMELRSIINSIVKIQHYKQFIAIDSEYGNRINKPDFVNLYAKITELENELKNLSV